MIITTLNKAWSEPNSTFDLFLHSFHVGKGTKPLLRHLVVACLDEEAYSRCSEVHPHRCYFMKTPGIDFAGDKMFMTPDYLKMMWRRIEFLGTLLKLRYNFIFTVPIFHSICTSSLICRWFWFVNICILLISVTKPDDIYRLWIKLGGLLCNPVGNIKIISSWWLHLIMVREVGFFKSLWQWF